MNIYEKYGRMVEAHDAEVEAHRKTIQLLREVQRDVAILGRLAVGAPGNDSWALMPPGEPETDAA